MDKVRVMRVIVYEGSREWVEKTLSGSLQDGTKEDNGNCIKVATIGQFPEIINTMPEPIVKGGKKDVLKDQDLD